MSADRVAPSTVDDEFPEQSRSRMSDRRQRGETLSVVARALSWVHGDESVLMPTDEEMVKFGINGALRTTVHVMRDTRAANKQLQVELANARAEIAHTKSIAMCDIERAKSAPRSRVRFIAETKDMLFGATGAPACGQLIAIDVPVSGATLVYQTTYVECIHPGMPVYGGKCALHAQVTSEHVMKPKTTSAIASAPAIAAPTAPVAPASASGRKHKGKSFAAAAAIASTMP